MVDIKDKISKLLALADSPNENEARAALLKARELMASISSARRIARRQRLKRSCAAFRTSPVRK